MPVSADRINDGGPAFPVPAIHDPGRDQVNSSAAYTGEAGMTLRDYFATKELARMEYGQCMVNDVPSAYDRIAKHCYRMADAMLKARAA